MATRDLPGSGTIKQSQVISEFNKGNNLLDYLGEGGVTGSAPLKLTDFYGTASGPELPSGPIHHWAERVHYHANNNQGRHVQVVSTQYNSGDVVLEGGHYTYGPNSKPSGLYCNKTKCSFTAYAGNYHSFTPPTRWGAGLSVIDGYYSSMEHTWHGAGYDPYWPDDWTGYAFKIAKADMPFDTTGSIDGMSGYRSGEVRIMSGRAVPNSVAIAVCVAASPDSSRPTFTGVAAQQGGPGRRAGSHTVAYTYIPVDENGNADYTFQASSWAVAWACLYQKSTRNVSPLDEEQEEVADTGPIVPTPPPEDE